MHKLIIIPALQFESWDYFTYSDPTHGDVNYISLSDAQSQNLVGVQDGMFKMSVSTADLVNGKRVSLFSLVHTLIRQC